jgi:hypothetical protein
VVTYEENSAPGYKRSKGLLTILFSRDIAGKHELKLSSIVKLKKKKTQAFKNIVPMTIPVWYNI